MEITDKMDSQTVKQLVNTYFNDTIGFGKYKDIAIKLLKETTDILDEFNIDYFLISGTLLGYVRHNDFIPWDDDMDLIVDASFLDKQEEIMKKYNNVKFMAMPTCKWMIKSYYEKGIIQEKKPNSPWPSEYKWTWPFIDLFIYGYDQDRKNMNFFNKKWNVDEFFPIQKKPFLGLTVSIPTNPDYFLKINYGSEYMTVLKSSNYCHKYEARMGKTVKMRAELLK